MRKEIFPAVISFYRIYCKNPDVVDSYIGSTNNLKQRVREHQSRCMNSTDPAYTRPLYTAIRANGGLSNWEFEEIERVECATCDEMRHIEQDFVYIHGANLNKDRAFTRKAPHISNTYYSIHREAILARYKEARLMAKNDICV